MWRCPRQCMFDGRTQHRRCYVSTMHAINHRHIETAKQIVATDPGTKTDHHFTHVRHADGNTGAKGQMFIVSAKDDLCQLSIVGNLLRRHG